MGNVSEHNIDLERLGRYIVSRRMEVGYKTRTDLANAMRMTVRTLSDIERGDRKASPGSYALIEGKLGWAPGSCMVIFRGGEPRLMNQQRGSELSHIATEELLMELRRRIIGDKPLGNGGWGGLDPFGNWPQDRNK